MKTKTLLLAASVLLGSLLVAASLLIVFFIDPFGWGTVSSERFSWEKFAQIQKGERIESAIKLLGKPIEAPEEQIALTSNPDDPCYAGTCKKYLFAGARFGASYREAIIIADGRGTIINVLNRLE